MQIYNAQMMADFVDEVNAFIELDAPEFPEVLFHYTSLEAVKSITQFHQLWATALDTQAKDPSELQAAIEEVSSLASRMDFGSDFSRLVFSFLEKQLSLRRPWMFLTCFCAEEESDFHWKNYGKYRLSIPVVKTRLGTFLPFRPKARGAEIRLQKCVYDDELKRSRIGHVLSLAMKHIEVSTRGPFEGPWMKDSAIRCAQDIAEVLLNIIASFKSKACEADREWRVICKPGSVILHTAPKMKDEDFAPFIKSDPKRHVELCSVSSSPYSAALPFRSIKRKAEADSTREVEELNTFFVELGWPEIKCL